MKKATILSGLPGSGKTCYVEMSLPPTVVVCSADHLFYQDGVYRFVAAELPAAHQKCFRKYIETVQAGADDVVVDNTNLSAAEIAPYVLGGEAYGYSVQVVRLLRDPSIAFSAQRHGVPLETFKRMMQQFWKRDVMPWWNVKDVKVTELSE